MALFSELVCVMSTRFIFNVSNTNTRFMLITKKGKHKFYYFVLGTELKNA